LKHKIIYTYTARWWKVKKK